MTHASWQLWRICGNFCFSPQVQSICHTWKPHSMYFPHFVMNPTSSYSNFIDLHHDASWRVCHSNFDAFNVTFRLPTVFHSIRHTLKPLCTNFHNCYIKPTCPKLVLIIWKKFSCLYCLRQLFMPNNTLS